MDHQQFYDEAKAAVEALESDRSVSRVQTIDALETLVDLINSMLVALEEDEEREA